MHHLSTNERRKGYGRKVHGRRIIQIISVIDKTKNKFNDSRCSRLSNYEHEYIVTDDKKIGTNKDTSYTRRWFAEY